MPTKHKKTSHKNATSSPTLNDLLIMKLQALFDVENQLIKALPVMAKKSSDPELKQGFEKHLKQTKEHAARLERAFDSLGTPAKKLQGEAIRGLVADAQWVIKNVKGDEALDANLIAAGQYVEHYEIAGYGAAIAWAKLLEKDDVVELLEMTITEEKDTDNELTKLAESKINERAIRSDHNDDNDDESTR